LTGVTGIFNTIKLKLDGGGGGSENHPGIDEIRIGESWADVTGLYVSAIHPANGEMNTPIDSNFSWTVANGWAVDMYLRPLHRTER